MFGLIFKIRPNSGMILKVRPNACRHLKNLCKLGLRLEFGLIFFFTSRSVFLVDAYVCQQVLADRIGLQTSLVSGEYSRAWNEIIMPSDDVNEASDHQRFSDVINLC